MTEQVLSQYERAAVAAVVNLLNGRSLPSSTQDVVEAMLNFGHGWASVDSIDEILRTTPYLEEVPAVGWVEDTTLKSEADVIRTWLRCMHAVHVGISEEWLLHSLPEVPRNGGYSTAGRRGLLLKPEIRRTVCGDYVPARRRSLPILVRTEDLLDDAPFFPRELDADGGSSAAMAVVRARTRESAFCLQRIQFSIGSEQAHVTLLATKFEQQFGLLAWTSPLTPAEFCNFQEVGWWMWDSNSPQPLSEPWELLTEPYENEEVRYRGLVFSTNVQAVLELVERSLRLFVSHYSNVKIDTSHCERVPDKDQRNLRLWTLVQRRRGANKNLPGAKCVFCTRNLSDDLSVARGYGPECKKKHVDTEWLDRNRITEAEVDLAVKSMGAHAPWESYATIEDAYRRIAQD